MSVHYAIAKGHAHIPYVRSETHTSMYRHGLSHGAGVGDRLLSRSLAAVLGLYVEPTARVRQCMIMARAFHYLNMSAMSWSWLYVCLALSASIAGVRGQRVTSHNGHAGMCM